LKRELKAIRARRRLNSPDDRGGPGADAGACDAANHACGRRGWYRAEWKQSSTHGAARIVVISGEPGIGKTRLASDFGAHENSAMFGARPATRRVHALARASFVASRSASARPRCVGHG
jgi:hypothetical protein